MQARPQRSLLIALRRGHKYRHCSTPSVQREAKDKSSTASAREEKSSPKELKANKTQAQLDAELRAKLSAMAGEGGEAGVEYEDGKPVSMKRGVRENMFRYI